jgi:hypothetical protein
MVEDGVVEVHHHHHPLGDQQLEVGLLEEEELAAYDLMRKNVEWEMI